MEKEEEKEERCVEAKGKRKKKNDKGKRRKRRGIHDEGRNSRAIFSQEVAEGSEIKTLLSREGRKREQHIHDAGDFTTKYQSRKFKRFAILEKERKG
jgi:hypothetical protein